jgi:hypothetical protein
MQSFETIKNCPCRKDNRCVNGLECSEKYCFLLNNPPLEPMMPASAWEKYDSCAIGKMTAKGGVQLN